MKLLRVLLQETMGSVEGSSTISKVLIKNGGGPISWSPSIGLTEKFDEDDEFVGVPALQGIVPSSCFTFTPSIFGETEEVNKLDMGFVGIDVGLNLI